MTEDPVEAQDPINGSQQEYSSELQSWEFEDRRCEKAGWIMEGGHIFLGLVSKTVPHE